MLLQLYCEYGCFPVGSFKVWRSMCRSTRQKVPSGTAAERFPTVHSYLFRRKREKLCAKCSVGCVETVVPSGMTAWGQNEGAAPCAAFVQGAQGSRAFLGVTILPPPCPLNNFPGDEGQTDGSWTRSITGHTHTHTHDAQRLPPVRNCALLGNKEPLCLTSPTLP